MYPYSIRLGLQVKGVPKKSTLGPKYILYGYMEPLGKYAKEPTPKSTRRTENEGFRVLRAAWARSPPPYSPFRVEGLGV